MNAREYHKKLVDFKHCTILQGIPKCIIRIVRRLCIITVPNKTFNILLSPCKSDFYDANSIVLLCKQVENCLLLKFYASNLE